MNRRLGPYQLKERLGSGGMAEVYLAHVQRRGNVVQPCVVKLLHQELARDDDFVDMLVEEARLVARLRHNNIASLYDIKRHDGDLFLVMEYVDGRDLHSILARATRLDRKLSLPFAVHVARGLCAGLHFAHTRRGPDGEPLHLVHRDVSPPNILVSTQGEVKLIDFGIAKFNSEAREKTRSGVIKGKFGYMSPEHAWDEALDQRADVFSVGVCLYETLTGRSLYGQSDDAMTMLRRAREADIDPITRWRDVPDDLARIVHRALEPNRADRFPTAHHMERRLAIVLRNLAPDYTGLDAGALVDEFFDTADPAIDQISPRVHDKDDTSRRSSDEVAPPQRDLDDATRPITDVPSDIRKSGRYLQPQSARDGNDHSRPQPPAERISREKTSRSPREETAQIDTGDDTNEVDEPTAKLTFADEKTELFGEQRISGPQPTISPDDLRRSDVPGEASNSSSTGGDTSTSQHSAEQKQNTRVIDDAASRSESEHLDDTATDPIRQTARTEEQARPSSPPSATSESPPPSGAPLAATEDMEQRVHARHGDLEHRQKAPDAGPDADGVAPETRPSVAGTGALPALKDSASSSDNDGDDDAGGLDRRIQIGLAAGFVVLALLYVMSRLFL